MSWWFLGLPFIVVLMTRLRWAALFAAAAGVVAGVAAAMSLGVAAFPVKLGVIFAAMAFAEAIAASIIRGGGLSLSLGLTLAAHFTVLWLIWSGRALDALDDRVQAAIWLLPYALLGGAVAAIGATLGRRS